MRRLFLRAAGCLFGVVTTMAAASSVAASPAPLELTEAQRLAIERSPRMAAYDAAIAAARNLATTGGLARAPGPPAAVQGNRPVLEPGADDLPVETGDRFGVGSVAQALRRIDYLPLTRSADGRAAAADAFAREAELETAQKTAAVVEIARRTALAWLECHYVEQMKRVAADEVKLLQAEMEDAERMYWSGRLRQAEFYARRSMLSMAEDKSSMLEQHERSARIRLKRWVGDGGDAPLGEIPNVDRIVLIAAALEGDVARHPDVALLDKWEQLAASEVRVAQGRDPDGAVALMQARRDEFHAAREEKLRSQVAELRAGIEEWQHARVRRDRFRREIAPLARERTHATLVAYRGGKATLAEVLDARGAESDVQMQTLQAERDVARMWAELNFALPAAVPVRSSEPARAENTR